MDILSHTFWGYGLFGQKRPWLAMVFGAMPDMISFVIDRTGVILDGTTLAYAIETIDSMCENPPLGYMVNCS